MFPGLNLYYTDPAKHIITAGYDLDYLDRDLSDLSDPSDLSDLSDPSDPSDLSDLSDLPDPSGLSDLSHLSDLSDLSDVCKGYHSRGAGSNRSTRGGKRTVKTTTRPS